MENEQQRAAKLRKRIERLLAETDLSYVKIGQIMGVTKQRVGQVAKSSRIRYQGKYLYNITKKHRTSLRLAALLDKKIARLNRREDLINEIRQLVEIQGHSFTKAAAILSKPASVIYKVGHDAGIRSRHKSLNPNFRNKPRK
jgi:predicted transcriptional regulator